MASLKRRFVRVTVVGQQPKDKKVFLNHLSYGPRIDFNVVKYPRVGAGLNTSQIKIFNLKDETASFIENEGKKVILEAGYSNNYNVIFVGMLKSVSRTKSGADIISTMFSSTIGHSLLKAYVSKSISKISLNDLLDELAEKYEFKIERPDFKDVFIIKRALFGDLRDVLITLGVENNFIWQIEDEILKIVPNVGKVKRIFKFNQSSGLLNIPEITEKGADIDIFLEPNINPSDQFALDSKFATFNLGALEFRERVRGGETQALFRSGNKKRFQGKFTVLNLTHDGSTHQNLWKTTLSGAFPQSVEV